MFVFRRNGVCPAPKFQRLVDIPYSFNLFHTLSELDHRSSVHIHPKVWIGLARRSHSLSWRRWTMSRFLEVNNSMVMGCHGRTARIIGTNSFTNGYQFGWNLWFAWWMQQATKIYSRRPSGRKRKRRWDRLLLFSSTCSHSIASPFPFSWCRRDL